MVRLLLIYGVISGLITICTILVGIVLSDSGSLGASQATGFLIMFLAFSLIYFGVRKYRDQEQGGVITFGKALLIGLGITAVAGIVYIIVWEIYLTISDYTFINDYAEAYIAEKEASGITAEELAKIKDGMAKTIEQYGNPFYRIPITFTEIFPIGLIVSLVSAFFLRFPKRKRG